MQLITLSRHASSRVKQVTHAAFIACQQCIVHATTEGGTAKAIEGSPLILINRVIIHHIHSLKDVFIQMQQLHTWSTRTPQSSL